MRATDTLFVSMISGTLPIGSAIAATYEIPAFSLRAVQDPDVAATLAWMRNVILGSFLLLASCGGSDAQSTASDAGTAPPPTTITPTDAGTAVDAGSDAGVDPCGSALFCETFESYPTVTTIANNQKLGPWHAELVAGSTMMLDATHVTSGTSALHVHIDQGKTAGGRLLADGVQPILAGTPTHLYGRMRMYIDANGTSINWTFFGASGKVAAGSPEAGRSATYAFSSLPVSNANSYAFVYGLSQQGDNQGDNAYHDCYDHSTTPMPSAWACLAFELDSTTRKLRLYKDGGATAILSMDNTGQGCVAPTVGTSPWYGPVVSQLYTGARSFHAMDAPLDVWIDDLVIDTKPVSCPVQ